jgi:hypothetical protein
MSDFHGVGPQRPRQDELYIPGIGMISTISTHAPGI